MTSERARRRATKPPLERPPAFGEDGDVEVLVDSQDRTRDRQLDRDARKPGPEGLQVLGELVHGEGRGADHAQLAARLGARGARQRLGLLHLGQDVAHPLEIGLAGVGEREPAGGAVEQAHAEVLLQVGHQPGDDRRRHVELARRAGEAALVDHREKTRIELRRSMARSSLFRFWQFAIESRPVYCCLSNA
jgi:hypothetical protein